MKNTSVLPCSPVEPTAFNRRPGDNGTSGEGGANGMFNEYSYFNGVTESVEEMLKHYDSWGSPETYPHMAAGWAVALNAPFGWMKQVASDFGGTRNGMVVSWPKVIKAAGEIRTQFGHVIDIAPTILEAAHLPEPVEVNGTKQIPMQGKSLVYTFADASAPERHTTQYFEIAGNRAIYHDGWFARTIHMAPWEAKPRNPLYSDDWELFNVRSDFSLSKNIAATQADKLKELQQLFMKEAEANQRQHVVETPVRHRAPLCVRPVLREDLPSAGIGPHPFHGRRSNPANSSAHLKA